MNIILELEKLRDHYKDYSYEKLTLILDKLIPSKLPVNVITIENKMFALKQREYGGANIIHRARINELGNGKLPFQKISDISYIPKEKAKKLITEFGRVNNIGETMFYSSINYHTACVETFSKGKILS